MVTEKMGWVKEMHRSRRATARESVFENSSKGRRHFSECQDLPCGPTPPDGLRKGCLGHFLSNFAIFCDIFRNPSLTTQPAKTRHLTKTGINSSFLTSHFLTSHFLTSHLSLSHPLTFSPSHFLTSHFLTSHFLTSHFLTLSPSPQRKQPPGGDPPGGCSDVLKRETLILAASHRPS